NFLGALVNQKNYQMDFWVNCIDAGGQLLEQCRLSRSGRRDDQTSLSFTDRRYQVKSSHAQITGFVDAKSLERIDTRELGKIRPFFIIRHREGIDRMDLLQLCASL